MADNSRANPGEGGDIFATDDIAGVKHWRSKTQWGADGSAKDTDDAPGQRFPVKNAEGLSASSLIHDQHTVATGTESALPAAACRRIRIKADIDNTATVYLGYVGVTVGTGYALNAGDREELEVSDASVLHFISGTAGQKVHYCGEV